LNTFSNSLSEVIIIGRTGFVYFAFDVAPLEVFWYCRHIRRAGGPFDVRETRNDSAWKHCPENWHGNVRCASGCSGRRCAPACHRECWSMFEDIVVTFTVSCVYCCSCLVCIVVILCVFVLLCVYCCFYFRCRTAG